MLCLIVKLEQLKDFRADTLEELFHFKFWFTLIFQPSTRWHTLVLEEILSEIKMRQFVNFGHLLHVQKINFYMYMCNFLVGIES